MRAFLYFNQKDSLSADIADTIVGGELFNTPTGAGWARSPSEQVLIKVEIAGQRRQYAPGRKIHLTVRKTDGTVLVDRRPPIGLFGETTDKWFETFVVYESGCDALRIRAEILGQQDSSVVEKHIDFVCGE